MKDEDREDHFEEEDNGEDDEQEEETTCPYCGRIGGCPHLLAVVDLSYNFCAGGYASDHYEMFEKEITKVFLKLLKKKRRPAPSWRRDKIQALWRHALKDSSVEENYVALDPYILTQLTIDLLGEAGGEEYSAEDPGGPGLHSALKLFFAKDPKEVFNSAISILKEDLQPETQ